MAYVKLDTAVLDSTLWIDRDAREVFITALLMAEPHEVKEPTPAIEVRTLDPSGFVVPSGWYGIVRAAGVGIVRRAGIDTDEGMAALERLSAPESESRTPDHGGRRLVRVDGGYLVLNFMRYRDRDQTAAERQQRYRDRNRDPLKKAVIKRDGERCGICGDPVAVREAQLDHIVPLMQGGRDTPENLQLAHPKCNNGKSGTSVESRWRHASLPLVGIVTRDRGTVTRNITQLVSSKQEAVSSKQEEVPTTASETWRTVWDDYPKRAGGNSRQAALKAYTARVRTGVPEQEMLAGVRRYARYIRATGREGTEYVKQAATFFGPGEHWKEAWDPPPDRGTHRANGNLAVLENFLEGANG